MPQEIIQVDAFTDRPFTGNPAGVCVMDSPGDDAWMQNVAAEMNLAETAFLSPRGEGFHLRWFTPTTEVDLCGHATLAAAHVLWETGRLSPDQSARFDTRSGLLTAKKNGDWIELDFPATPALPTSAPAGLIESLGSLQSRVVAIAKSRFDYLIEIDADQRDLAAMSPDLKLLATIDTRGIIVTTRRTSDSRFDFVSRFFAPRVGIDEDPVTGSAHCALGPYWHEKLGKNPLLAYQASKRGGFVRITLKGDRASLGGQAITVMRAILL